MNSSSTASSRQISKAVLLVLFAAALLLRLWAVHDIGRDPLSELPILDGWSYHNQALEILEGHYFGQGVFFQDPLYPMFLAAIYAIGGEDLSYVRGVQCLLGAMTVVLLALIGSWLGGRGVGLLSGLIAAAYPPLIAFDTQIMKETLGIFFLSATLWLLFRAGLGRAGLSGAFIAGIVFALAVMTRGNVLLTVPLAGVWLLWQGHTRFSWRRGLSMAVLFFLSVGLTILPITLHNLIAGDDLVLLTSQGGQNFFIGNNPWADGASGRPPELRKHPRYERTDFEYEAIRATGRQMKPSEISQYWMGQAKQWMRENPAAAAKLWLRKLLLLINVYEIPDNLDFYFYRQNSVILSNPLGGMFVEAGGWTLILGGWGLLFPLCIGGMMLTVRRRQGGEWLTGFILVYSLSLIAFHIYDRYRLTLLPAVIPLASYYILGLYRAATARVRPSPLFILSGLVVILFALLAQIDTGRYSFARSHYMLGIGYSEQGNLHSAIKEYQRALDIEPGYAEAWNNMGSLYYEIGQREPAKLYWQTALRYKPNLAEAYNNLGTLAAENGDLSEAIELYDRAAGLRRDYFTARFNQAHALYLLGRTDESIDRFSESFLMDRQAFIGAIPHLRQILSPEDTRLLIGKLNDIATSGTPRTKELCREALAAIAATDNDIHRP